MSTELVYKKEVSELFARLLETNAFVDSGISKALSVDLEDGWIVTITANKIADNDRNNRSRDMTREELIRSIRARKNREPLSVLKYEDPFGPAVADEDWEFNS